MQALKELLGVFSINERLQLRQFCAAATTIPLQMIIYVLDEPTITSEEYISFSKITPATYNKSLSLAISAVYEFLSRQLQNPYDEIFLIKELLIRGLTKQAKRQYTKLEKDFELKFQYPQLNALYHEGSRICYHTGDKKQLAILRKKIAKNSSRLLTYNEIDKAIMAAVLNIVRKPSKSSLQKKEILRLKTEALKFGHPILIHNALTMELAYYTSAEFDLNQAYRIIKELNTHILKQRLRIDDYSYRMARYNYSKFICDYAVQENPESLFNELIPRIGAGGTIEVASFYVNYFFYFLTTGKTEEAKAIGLKIINEQAQDRLSYLRHYIAAWLAWLEKDYVRFRVQILKFYNDPDRHDSPINDFYIRVLETIVAIEEGSFLFAYSKVEALKKFSYRSLPAPQRDFLTLVNALNRRIQVAEMPKLKSKHDKKKALERQEIVHRAVRYLFDGLDTI